MSKNVWHLTFATGCFINNKNLKNVELKHQECQKCLTKLQLTFDACLIDKENF